ncbi:type 4 pilus major pilin [Vreelandella rituensis]|uniref:Type 4 secretion system PilS N-terminal domain-containing protein n=1 Tax=Vreelandella rituensis TaxID=2282306 RepID=A0A368UDG3_9GAMM|nr:type 4 pilus major pilin [Halomonas rituensis]RCV93813.1 hypothetical protein DU506_01255 [Halomonas rituensis]
METKAARFTSYTPSQSLKKATQGGWAMLETLIAIILGLLMLIGVFVYFQMGSASAKIADARQDLMITKANTERLFRGQPSYLGLNNVLATRAEVVPTSMYTAEGVIVNRFGGEVTIESVDNGRGADSHFQVTMEEIPQEACIELGTYTRNDWVGVTINGTAVDFNSVSEASTNCSDLNENQMVFMSR